MDIQFRTELISLLNRFSKENGSDTPDFILADYLSGCLDVYDKTLQAREQWCGRNLKRTDHKIEIDQMEFDKTEAIHHNCGHKWTDRVVVKKDGVTKHVCIKCQE